MLASMGLYLLNDFFFFKDFVILSVLALRAEVLGSLVSCSSPELPGVGARTELVL